MHSPGTISHLFFVFVQNIVLLNLEQILSIILVIKAERVYFAKNLGISEIDIMMFFVQWKLSGAWWIDMRLSSAHMCHAFRSCFSVHSGALSGVVPGSSWSLTASEPSPGPGLHPGRQ